MLRFTPPEGPQAQRGPLPQDRAPTPFSPAPALKPLTVVVDSEWIDGLDGNDLCSPDVILGGLLTLDTVRLLRYADDGPPPGLPRGNDHTDDAVRGWIVVRGYEADIHVWRIVVHDGKSVTETCFGGDIPSAAEQDCNTSADADLDFCTASKRRRADAIAAQAAAAAGADIYITSRPYLFSVGWEIAYGLLCAKPREALPLVSLYLRTQGEFIDWRSLDGHGTTSMNRGLFYARSVISLVPRLFGALVGLAERAQASDDRRAIGLAQAMFGRLQQTLVARDEMYRALNRPQNSDVAFEALTAFDLAVLTLMGAVDASARLVHRLLDLDGKDRSARWQWADWRKLVAEKCPAAAAAVEAENRLDVLTVLTELRNTIHAVPLDPLAVVKGRVPVETRIGLPADRGDAMLASIDRLGGRNAWGVQTTSGRHHADPGELLDHLIERVTPMLNDLLQAMSAANFSDAPAAPSEDFWARFPGDPAQVYRWQIGLSSYSA